METKSTAQLNMDLPAYSVFPKLVDTKKKWIVEVSAALLLAVIIVAGTLVGVYMTQKHIEQIWNQGTLLREMNNSSYNFNHVHQRDVRKMLDICFAGNHKRVTRQLSKYPLEIFVAAFDTDSFHRYASFSNAETKVKDPGKQCPLHQKPHPLLKCRAFREKTLQDRKTFLKENYICYRCCSSTSHLAKNCDGLRDVTIIDIRLPDFVLQQTLTCKYISDKIVRRSIESNQHEEKLKPPIVTCDIEKENLTSPVVIPQVDYILSVWLLEAISKNKDEYRRSLKEITASVKRGGDLILFVATNVLFSIDWKLHLLSNDTSFVRNVLVGEGLDIVQYEMFPTKYKSNLVDLEGVLVVVAHKPK